MRDQISGGVSRMAVAKGVLRDVIGSLQDQPGLYIALRVYGSKVIDEYACQDSELLQPFGTVGEVRDHIIRMSNPSNLEDEHQSDCLCSSQPRTSR